MKAPISGLTLVWFTTVFLILFVLLSQLPVNFTVLFALMVIGQVLVLFMVYRVLKDKYQTDKSFEDWYEDHPADRPEK